MKTINYFALIDASYYNGYKKKIKSICDSFNFLGIKSISKIYTNTSFIGLLIFQIKIIFSNSNIIILRTVGERTFILLPSLILSRLMKKKIILEIPSPLSKLVFEKKNKTIKDKIYINLNNYFLSLIFLISNNSIIYDYETDKYNLNKNKFIFSTNAVVSNHFTPNERKKILTNNLNFIFIGYLSNWHGIEKFIYSIYEFTNHNKTININLNIYGKIEKNYQKKIFNLINKYHLKNHIKINESVYSIEMINKILSDNHIGIGSMSLKSSKSYFRSELKLREYCAAGIPFLFNANDIDFKNFKYALNIDSENINIDKILSWYQKLPKDTPKIMHEYAKQYLDYNVKIKKLNNDLKL